MRRLILIILLSGTFLGGYQLGRIPNGPDLLAMGARAVAYAEGFCQWAGGWIRDKKDKLGDRRDELAACGEQAEQCAEKLEPHGWLR